VPGTLIRKTGSIHVIAVFVVAGLVPAIHVFKLHGN
jgi:hypothetical protein